MTLKSDSDRWIAATLPAILVFLSGWFLFLRNDSKERDLLERRIVNMGDLGAKHLLTESAKRDLADLAGEKSRLRENLDAEKLGFDRSLAMSRISALCEANGLQIGQTSIEQGSNRLPVSLKAVESKFTTSDGQPPQVWRLELAGSYPAVTRLLMDLASSAPMMVPLNFTMEADPKERRYPTWNLYIWL